MSVKISGLPSGSALNANSLIEVSTYNSPSNYTSQKFTFNQLSSYFWTSPTLSKVLLSAGNSSAGSYPIKFTSGTLMSTPEVGSVEFLSERFYVTPTSTARMSLSGVLFTGTQTITIVNSNVESTLMGTGVGSLTLPSNFFVAGKQIRYYVYGYHSTVANPTITINVKLGSTTVSTTGGISSGNSTNTLFRITGVMTCYTSGNSGTIWCQGVYEETGGGANTFPMTSTSATTINTTSSLTLDITAQWDAATSSDTITQTNISLEVIN